MFNLLPWKKSQHNNDGGTLSLPLEREFARIREDFDRLLDRMWSGSLFSIDSELDRRWGMDVDERDNHYMVRLDAPGFEVNDFDVYVSGDHLVVKAEHKESKREKNGSSYRYGRFERRLPLPDGVDAEQVEAKYHSGVLELQIPKGKEAENVKRITVQS